MIKSIARISASTAFKARNNKFVVQQSSAALFTATTTRRSYATSSGNVPETSQENFQTDVIESNIPVIVDVYADWCGPCKMLAPVLDKIAGEYAGKLKIVKLNSDDNPELVDELGVQGLPTLVAFKNGNVLSERMVGVQSRTSILDFCRDRLGVEMNK